MNNSETYKTYKTEHPTIKEISIGDRFIRNDGEIVTFVEYIPKELCYPYKMSYSIGNFIRYTHELKCHVFDNEYEYYNIKYKILSLKDKLDLI